MKVNGAKALILSLIDNGVDTIFGIPGGVVIPIYDALYDFENVKSVLMRHEQGGAHAADGYARATGRIGCCFATSGPGATNLVTGLATASMDSIPMIAITGQVKTVALGKDSFQEADILGITMPVTKHNYLVKDVKDLPRIISEACHVATTGRPGPVLVDIPMDVSVSEIDYTPVKEVNIRSYDAYRKINISKVDEAIKLINEAERAVIYAGGGIIASGASDILVKLAEKRNIHVTTTLMGKGVIDENHSLSLGMLGMHGTAYANHAVNECDLLITIGARFDDRVTGKISAFARKAKVIHIDIDPAEIDKVVTPDVYIVGDAKEVLNLLYEKIDSKDESEWDKSIDKWKETYPLYVPEKSEDKIYPQQVIDTLSKVTDGADILTTDVGQNQMWSALYYKVRYPRCFISSGGLGTMGFGLPAAIGAAFGSGKKVWAVCGDGGFQMNLQELIIAVQYKLPVKIVLLNNECLGMVRQWQELFWDKRYSGIDLSCHPDYVKLAEAYGMKAIRVTKYEEIEETLKYASNYNEGPILMEFTVCKENVFPMIPAGQSIEEMMLKRPKIKE